MFARAMFINEPNIELRRPADHRSTATAFTECKLFFPSVALAVGFNDLLRIQDVDFGLSEKKEPLC